ncbi:MAG: hypothetical protein Q9191_001821 [Dirinaria sp. TL-2023a]
MEDEGMSRSQCPTDEFEPSLPLSVPWPLRRNTSRKRDIDEFVADSSDPPIFSSDDSPATVENYIQPNSNLKRQRRGPWYNHSGKGVSLEQHYRPERRRRGPFRRDLDSGVWMGSDETEEMDEEPRQEKGLSNGEYNAASGCLSPMSIPPREGKEHGETSLLKRAAQYFEDPGLQHGPIFPYWQQQPQDLEAFHRAQKRALILTETYADSSQRVLDLSGLSMRHLLPSTLQALRFLARTTPASQDEDYGEIYRPIELYLAGNELTVLPGELYELDHLTILSARANDIVEISPALSRLRRLEELNLSNNNLRWLPFEILDLFAHRLGWISAALNPFIQPQNLNSAGTIFENSPQSGLHALCRTSVAYLSTDGSSVQGWTPAPSSTLNFQPQKAKMLEPPLSERTKVPSLLELALRSAYASMNLSQLPFFLPTSRPSNIDELLKRAWYIKSYRGQKCTVCNKEYLIPRTEWVEWWRCQKRPVCHVSARPYFRFLEEVAAGLVRRQSKMGKGVLK